MVEHLGFDFRVFTLKLMSVWKLWEFYGTCFAHTGKLLNNRS